MVFRRLQNKYLIIAKTACASAMINILKKGDVSLTSAVLWTSKTELNIK